MSPACGMPQSGMIVLKHRTKKIGARRGERLHNIIPSARARRPAFANLNSEGGSSSTLLDATKLCAFGAKITSPDGAVDPPCFYFGASEATIFSKRGSPRNGSHQGSSFNRP